MANANPFIEEKLETREWHDRLGDGFWKALHRSALYLEEVDARLANPAASPCVGYESQSATIAKSLALVSVLDRDDYLFLPRELSLAALCRGVTVEQFVGQWRGNLLDPAKGRLQPGTIAAEAFQIVPAIGRGLERLEHAIGMSLAMRLRNHTKITVLPLTAKELRQPETQRALCLAARNTCPILFFVIDGVDNNAVEAAAETAGLRAVDAYSPDVLATLKLFKGQVDRARSRREPVLIYFSHGEVERKKLSDIVQETLDRKKWRQDENLLQLLHEEIRYGIERAQVIPPPPKNTVIQDVRFKVEAHLSAEWQEWRNAHGK